MCMNLNELMYKLGYRFDDEDVLRAVIAHNNSDLRRKHYERFEHLGEAVLQMVITEYLFKNFSDSTEGTLAIQRADLICPDTQSRIADELTLSRYIQKSPGVEPNSGRYDKFVQAIVGAVYVDAGFGERGLGKAKSVIFRLWKLKELSTKSKCKIM